jgi:Spy/CpxP family protein refolding chaperone
VTLHDTLTDPRPTWHNPRILALLLMIFVCGMACGAFATRYAFSRLALRNSAASWKGSGRASTMAHLKKDLDLTPAQAEQIGALLDDLAKYYDNLQGQMDDFRQDGKERIMKILTLEQQKKFSRILNEMSTRIHAEPLDAGPARSKPAPPADPQR